MAKGTKLGGTLQLVLHDLDITARVTEIPEKITVDVTNLAVGDTVKVADIRDDYQSIKINHEDDETIVSVVSTGSEEEEENVEEKETVEQPV